MTNVSITFSKFIPEIGYFMHIKYDHGTNEYKYSIPLKAIRCIEPDGNLWTIVRYGAEEYNAVSIPMAYDSFIDLINKFVSDTEKVSVWWGNDLVAEDIS